jgi:DNA-binding phage protein
MLSKRGNPELRTINRMLAELGFSFAIKPQWSSEKMDK